MLAIMEILDQLITLNLVSIRLVQLGQQAILGKEVFQIMEEILAKMLQTQDHKMIFKIYQ